MPWTNLNFSCLHQIAREAEPLLEELGAAAVTIGEGKDVAPQFELEPGVLPDWEQVNVTALFDSGSDFERIIASLCDHFPALSERTFHKEPLPEQDWERTWMDQFHPIDFGHGLWICPTSSTPPEPDATVVMLDPGLAFGTGTHETTALCMQWLAEHRAEGCTVLDYGCGSGILAVAALKLGATSATGVDIDPRALTASEENAANNGVAEKLDTCLHGELAGEFSADLLLANILANTLIELKPLLLSHLAPGGRLILSGILREQAHEVIQAYLPEYALQARYQGDWAMLCPKSSSED